MSGGASASASASASPPPSSQPISVGSRVDFTGVTVNEDSPKNTLNGEQLNQLFQGKTVVVFGVPGAFTPGCSGTHLPGFLRDADRLKAGGVDEIMCVAVNDAYVMSEWGKISGATGKIRMIADTNAQLVKRLGLDFFAAGLGGIRSKRFSAVISDGIVKQINVEPDSTGLTCSLVDKIKLPIQ